MGAILDAAKVFDSLHARDIYRDRPIGLLTDDSERQVWDEGAVALQFRHERIVGAATVQEVRLQARGSAAMRRTGPRPRRCAASRLTGPEGSYSAQSIAVIR
ncbi:MAG TPA: hypothetical protein VMW65_02015 [Chloroflexota bacterium]|nr:hypothetical protein [Chloroflexota bacterium]